MCLKIRCNEKFFFKKIGFGVEGHGQPSLGKWWRGGSRLQATWSPRKPGGRLERPAVSTPWRRGRSEPFILDPMVVCAHAPAAETKWDGPVRSESWPGGTRSVTHLLHAVVSRQRHTHTHTSRLVSSVGARWGGGMAFFFSLVHPAST